MDEMRVVDRQIVNIYARMRKPTNKEMEALAVSPAEKRRTELNQCPHCGGPIPLDRWLRTQTRTLWTTAELVSRYGGTAERIGRELKRLGCKMKSIRHRLANKRLSKKRALYCVKPESFARFDSATSSQLRYWLASEHYYEYSTVAAAAVARVTQIVAEHATR
jgi:hypothetical protein